ncbi:hypothetical protein [Anabaena sp. PCC 7108]|uniref:hypothetical protein n=1 Tax=Anabaena sp. PCC 7108 TaxID=163908 RepID=UPI00034BFC77|nr:hypothetical protein [Anabaena sp. PCC 7108]
MTVHLSQIGIPIIRRGQSLLEEYPQNIVGSFWVMCGAYGFFNDKPIPDWWIDIDSAQSIINASEQGLFMGGYKNALYAGFCIIVVADSLNPVNLSYVIENLRMLEGEGINLLRMRMYLPPFADDLSDIVGNSLLFDGIVQIHLDDLLLAQRHASLSLVGWRIFGSMVRSILVRAGEDEVKMRSSI